jgi:hypothetical protein
MMSSIPSPISLSDFGFGNHPARLRHGIQDLTGGRWAEFGKGRNFFYWTRMDGQKR